MTALLSQESDLKVVAQVERLEEVHTAIRQTRAEVVVLDIDLPGAVPIDELCGELCAPGSGLNVLVLMERWIDCGHSLLRLAPRVGILAVEGPPRRLIEGIRQLMLGHVVLDPELALAGLAAGSNPLTEREREVLRLCEDGTPTKAIAAKLFLSAGTVRNYLSRTMMKTGARSRFEAARIAHEEGWI